MVVPLAKITTLSPLRFDKRSTPLELSEIVLKQDLSESETDCSGESVWLSIVQPYIVPPSIFGEREATVAMS